MNVKAKYNIDHENGAVSLTIVDGEGNTVDERAVNLTELPQNILTALAARGLKEKLADSHAGHNQTENPTATVTANVDRLIEQMRNGEFPARGQGQSGPRVTRLAQAVARLYEISQEEAAEKVSELDDESRKALRGHPQVQKVMADIRAEETAAKAEDQELPDLPS